MARIELEKTVRRQMTGEQFEEALKRLSISLTEAEKLLDLNVRQVYRYRKDLAPVPVPVALLLNVMIEYDIPKKALLEDEETG